MMDPTVSQFIDDELSLDEKIEFVERVHEDRTFMDESIELLRQEKLIRADVVDRIPALEFKTRRRLFSPMLQPMGLLASALGLALVILLVHWPSQVSTPISHRFVIYRPDVSQVEITGTFTEWKRIPMNRIGSSGYWEITLDLPKGEHRFTYMLEGHQRFADPTILAQEQDDFGGKNSVLVLEEQA
jgi:hypothetical protein